MYKAAFFLFVNPKFDQVLTKKDHKRSKWTGTTWEKKSQCKSRNQQKKIKSFKMIPRIQTIIQLTFKKNGWGHWSCQKSSKRSNKIISQIENKLTRLANKMKSTQQGYRGPQQSSSAWGGARGGRWRINFTWMENIIETWVLREVRL